MKQQQHNLKLSVLLLFCLWIVSTAFVFLLWLRLIQKTRDLVLYMFHTLTAISSLFEVHTQKCKSLLVCSQIALAFVPSVIHCVKTIFHKTSISVALRAYFFLFSWNYYCSIIWNVKTSLRRLASCKTKTPLSESGRFLDACLWSASWLVTCQLIQILIFGLVFSNVNVVFLKWKKTFRFSLCPLQNSTWKSTNTCSY